MDRVYIFKARFENAGKPCFKIGKSSGKSSVDRLLQVQRDHFMKYRYTFFAAIRRDRECVDAFKIETQLHHLFKDHQYYHDKKHDGSTEWFMVEEDVLLRAYDELIPTKKK